MREASGLILGIAPLFPVAVGLIVGIVLDRFNPLDPPWIGVYGAAFVVVSLIAAFRRARSRFGVLLVLVASMCLGAALHLNAARTLTPSSIERYTGGSGVIARLRGRVVSKPQILSPPENPFGRWTYGSERTAFLLQVESIEGESEDIPVTGRVRVTVGEAVLDLRENERVEVFGRLYRFKPPRNPGSFDWATFYRRQGVVAGMGCRHRENVRRPDADPAPGRRNLLKWLRTTTRGMLTDDLATGTDEEASLLEAMVLGHRSRLDRRLNDLFIRAGCIHFLAVSGIHVVIVMFFTRLGCRLLMARPRTCTLAMMVAVIVYAAIAEPRPPILRASVIALIYCVARLLHRERSYLNWISAAGIVLAIIDPETVFDIGFQLSFAAVLGVSYLSPAIPQTVVGLRTWFARCVLRRPFGDDLTPVRASGDRGLLTLQWHDIWGRLRRYLSVALGVTFAAWLAALPLVAIYFHRVHLWGAPNSFIVLPLVSLVMGLGFAKLVVGAVSPTLGSAIGAGLTTVDSWLIGLVDGLACLPGASVPVAGPPWWVTLSYYVFLTVLIWRFPRRQPAVSEPAPMPDRARRPDLRGSRGACVVTLLLLVVAVTAWQWPKRPGRLTVTFLAVGRGSAMVIELPDGRTILCDAGSSSPYDIGRSAVIPFLRHRGIRQIDRVHLSHANLDHFSGLPTVIEEIPTGPVIVNGYFESRSPAGSPSRHLLELLDRRGRWVQTLDAPPTRWELDGVTFEHLSPPDGLTDEVSTNNTSTVLRVSYAGHSLLLTGDIDEHAQRALIDQGNIHADVLALPHHGAVRSSTGSFIAAVAPSVVIRSSSERTEETHSGLQQIIGTIRGTGSVPELYNTADVGAVEVVIDRDGVRVSPALLQTETPAGSS